ncbi:hypothetical protein [Nitrospira lenta]|uniref:Type II secretion system protein n=1 Tax=Nitrospira lenta TaxID=1436998 RepID=A0A330L8C1_9BACT|nr:hypothetical protein [Nitrospira lenta]SPP66111.1 conserved hypothetical protein [Nitrospira lenta]
MAGSVLKHRAAEQGFSYVVLMFTIVLIGLGTTMAARQWKVMIQRELEVDLISKGIEIQNALAFYSASMKAGRVVPGEVYPQTLAELTRSPKPFLRKVYGDPVGHGDWELVRAPTGGIMGVRSKSKGKPIWQHNFPPAVRHFDGRKSHYEWVFQHPNPSATFVGMAGPGAMVPGSAGPQGASPGAASMAPQNPAGMSPPQAGLPVYPTAP